MHRTGDERFGIEARAQIDVHVSMIHTLKHILDGTTSKEYVQGRVDVSSSHEPGAAWHDESDPTPSGSGYLSGINHPEVVSHIRSGRRHLAPRHDSTLGKCLKNHIIQPRDNIRMGIKQSSPAAGFNEAPLSAWIYSSSKGNAASSLPLPRNHARGPMRITDRGSTPDFSIQHQLRRAFDGG